MPTTPDRKTTASLIKFVVCIAGIIYTVYKAPVSSKTGACLPGFEMTADLLKKSAFERIQVHRGECFFPNDYEDGAKNFIKAATEAGAELHSMPVGNDGLKTDVAIFRTGADPERFLVHLSGTHGPEGYVGSAIQNAALLYIKSNGLYQPAAPSSDNTTVETTVDASGNTISADTVRTETEVPASNVLLPTLVFVHAVNPFGFKNHRRVNEDNVDLNRNFLSPEEWAEVKALDPNYARHVELRDVLNPTSRPFPFIWLNDLYTLAISGYYMLQYGKNTIKTAMVSGNYINPTGYSYGGQEYTQSTRNLMDLLMVKLAIPDTAKKFVLIDVHSGLGPSGVDTLLDVGFNQQQVEEIFPTEYNIKGTAIGGLKSGTAPTKADTDVAPAAGPSTGKVDEAAAVAAASEVSAGYEMVKGVITGNFCNNMLTPNLSPDQALCVAQVTYFPLLDALHTIYVLWYNW